MTRSIKTAVSRIEDALTLVRSLVVDLHDETDLVLRPTLAALDRVEEELGHATAPRETAGNMFKQDKSGEQIRCSRCGAWEVNLPSGKTACLYCDGPVLTYKPVTITPEERALRNREIEAITQGQYQWPFGKEK